MNSFVNKTGNGTDVSDADVDADMIEINIPWLWILIGAGVLFFLGFLFFIVLVIVKRSGGNVIMVTRPEDSSFGAEVGNVGVISGGLSDSDSANSSKSLDVSQKKVEEKGVPDIVGKKVIDISALTPKAVALVPISKKVVEQSVALLPENIRYIKYYSHNVSGDPKVRIEYLIDNGEVFLKDEDYVSAKQMYVLIFEEYKELEVHDEELYQKIVVFKKKILDNKVY